MKKVVSLVLILLVFSMTACVASTAGSTTPIQNQTTSIEIPTTSARTTTTTTPFVPVSSATVESEVAVFYVQIDALMVDGSRPVITVRVEIVAKVDIDYIVGTISYGPAGILGIRIVSLDDSKTQLFSELYDDVVLCEVLDVHIDAGETLARQLQFARRPFPDWWPEDVETSPVGNYKVQVKLGVPDEVWIDTGILITVTD